MISRRALSLSSGRAGAGWQAGRQAGRQAGHGNGAAVAAAGPQFLGGSIATASDGDAERGIIRTTTDGRSSQTARPAGMGPCAGRSLSGLRRTRPSLASVPSRSGSGVCQSATCVRWRMLRRRRHDYHHLDNLSLSRSPSLRRSSSRARRAAARFSVRSALVRQSVSQSVESSRADDGAQSYKSAPSALPPCSVRPTRSLATSDCNRFDLKFEV